MDRPNCVATFLKSSHEKDSLTELHFQTLTLCVCLQKACLLVGHMETHTHTHSALWQNMIDKYKERAEGEARIIKQKEKCKKILQTTKAKGASII